MKNLKSLLFVGFLFYASKVYLCGAGFELPTGTPGLQAAQPDARLVHVIIPGTNIDLCFPRDGSQPTTERAGLWSSARYVGRPNDDLVSDWWVRVFGGNSALSAIGVNALVVDPPMGFDGIIPLHIINVSRTAFGTPHGFIQQFWQDFRTIAADPVGRVLLYRLLIEIRRVDNNGNGCCGDDVVLPNGRYLDARNNCRGIEIYFDQNASFNSKNHIIKFSHNNIRQAATLAVIQQSLSTVQDPVPNDMVLFHEMLHWFHWMRNPFKQEDNAGANPRNFKCAMRCYYGPPPVELCAWGNIDAEEIATIWGCPNLNRNFHPYSFNGRDLINRNAFPLPPQRPLNNGDIVVQINGINQYVPVHYKFLNGDDLSENAYRASRRHHMRFGHATVPICLARLPNNDTNNIPDRFRLAHKVAWDCYQKITGTQPVNWDLVQGQAIR